MRYFFIVFLCFFCVGCTRVEEVDEKPREAFLPDPIEIHKRENWGIKEYRGVRWDTNEYVKMKTSLGTCTAFLSEDRKYAWILSYKLKKKKDISCVEIPNNIYGSKVIYIGQYYAMDYDEGEDEACQNFFDVTIYDGGDTYYDREEVKRLEEIKRIVIPGSVRGILTDSFSYLKKLEYIELPRDLQEIGRGVFWKSAGNLKEITLPAKNEYFTLSEGCLIEKNKKSLHLVVSDRDTVRVPEGVEKTGDVQISEKVKKLVLPSTIKKIGKNTFLTLEEIEISEDNPWYAVKGDCLYEKTTGKLINYFVKNGALRIPAEVIRIPYNIINHNEPVKITVDKRNPVYAAVDDCVYEKERKKLMIIQVRGNKLVVPDGIERIEDGSGLIYMGDKEKVEMILLPKSLKPKFRDWNPYADYGERDVEVIQKR